MICVALNQALSMWNNLKDRFFVIVQINFAGLKTAMINANMVQVAIFSAEIQATITLPAMGGNSLFGSSCMLTGHSVSGNNIRQPFTVYHIREVFGIFRCNLAIRCNTEKLAWISRDRALKNVATLMWLALFAVGYLKWSTNILHT